MMTSILLMKCDEINLIEEKWRNHYRNSAIKNDLISAMQSASIGSSPGQKRKQSNGTRRERKICAQPINDHRPSLPTAINFS
jgi:hypothetical protein